VRPSLPSGGGTQHGVAGYGAVHGGTGAAHHHPAGPEPTGSTRPPALHHPGPPYYYPATDQGTINYGLPSGKGASSRPWYKTSRP
jgi:hypothetical protein